MKGRITGYGDKARYYLDGQEVTREAFAAAFPPVKDFAASGAGLISFKEMRSRALAVHPKQVAEANARAERLHLTVRYAPDGSAILPDRRSRRELMRVEGVHDEDGGYLD